MFMRVAYPNSLFTLRGVDDILSDFANRPASFIPATDIAEYDDNYELVVELPGVKKEDLKISVENGVLTIGGERKHYNFPEGTKVLHHESYTHPFKRSFELPSEVNAGAISAELKEGVLRISLPKSEQSRAREVHVQ